MSPAAGLDRKERSYRALGVRSTLYLTLGVLVGTVLTVVALSSPGALGGVGPAAGLISLPVMFGLILGLTGRGKAQRGLDDVAIERAQQSGATRRASVPDVPDDGPLTPRRLIVLLEELESVAWSDASNAGRQRVIELRAQIDGALQRDSVLRERAARLCALLDEGEVKQVVRAIEDAHDPPPQDATLETQSDFLPPTLLGVAMLGSFIGLASGLRATERAGVIVCALLSSALAGYLLVWGLVRRGRERRVLFRADRVWLPASGVRLYGRWLPYLAIESAELIGDGTRRLRIRGSGWTLGYHDNFVDVGELRERLLLRVERARRIAGE